MEINERFLEEAEKERGTCAIGECCLLHDDRQSCRKHALSADYLAMLLKGVMDNCVIINHVGH
jgi:hypothetical protein